MITLSDDTTTLTLHPDLFWSDEFSWLPVEQTASRTITGAQIVQTQGRIGGRPITLEPEGDDSAWMPRSDVQQLRTWAATPGQELTLALRDDEFTVIFRHQDGSPLQAVPILHYDEMEATDFYRVTLRFMEI